MQPSLQHSTILPVLTIDRAEDAVAVAGALLEGGLDLAEVSLRTPRALAAIRAIATTFPGFRVGAGSILRPADVTAAQEAGARFLTSPCLTADLAAAGLATGLPYLPGAMTPSEVLTAREMNFSFLKFFPAREAGGVAMLRHYAGLFPGVAFCPAGSLDEAECPDYLALANVPMVSAPWIAARDLIAAGNWATIIERARRAAAITKPR